MNTNVSPYFDNFSPPLLGNEALRIPNSLRVEQEIIYNCVTLRLFYLLHAANSKCEKAGCGEWKPPVIDNPAYKGKWSAPLIDNPNYKVQCSVFWTSSITKIHLFREMIFLKHFV